MEGMKVEMDWMTKSAKDCASSEDFSEASQPTILRLRGGMHEERGSLWDIVAAWRKEMAL